MKKTLLAKTILLLLVTVAISTVLTAMVFRYTGIKSYGDVKISELTPRAQYIAKLSSQYLQGYISRQSFEGMINYDRGIWDAAPYLYDGQGNVFGSLVNSEYERNTGIISNYVHTVLKGTPVAQLTVRGGDTGVVVGVPITSANGNVIGAVFLIKSIDELNAAWGSLTSSLPISMGLVTLIAIPVAYLASKGITKPIAKMNGAAMAMAKGDFAVRAYEAGSGELATLGRSLNELSQALSRTIGELTFEKNRLKGVLDGLREGIIAANDKGEIIQLNPAALELTGVESAEELKESSIYKELSSQFDSILPNGTIRWAELKHKNAVLRFTVSAIGGEGGEKNMLVMIQDVTQAARLEQTRRDYVANVSHELRTPIASIRGLSDALFDGLVKKDEDKRRYYGYINHEAMRLSRLIDDLLELSRLQSGAVAIELRRLNINELVYDVANRYGEICKEKNTKINALLPDEDYYALGNEDRCEQVLVALVDNAIKHSDGDVNIYAKEADDRYIIGVSNLGSIADEDIDHLFERFYKADRAHSGEGTGLGLAIAKEVIELMGQRIWCKSGDGTVEFAFTLNKYKKPQCN